MNSVEGVEGVNLTSGFFSKRSLMGENPEIIFTPSTLSTGNLAVTLANCADSDRRNRAKG